MVIKIFVCLNCQHLFENPKKIIETHGFTDGVYENQYCCPRCNGSFVETDFCDCCGKYITGKYIKTKQGNKFCEHCYTEYKLTDSVI